MKHCPNGHFPARYGEFCTQCGSKMVDVADPKCPACGEKISELEGYCANCGNKLESKTKQVADHLTGRDRLDLWIDSELKELTARVTALEERLSGKQKD